MTLERQILYMLWGPMTWFLLERHLNFSEIRDKFLVLGTFRDLYGPFRDISLTIQGSSSKVFYHENWLIKCLFVSSDYLLIPWEKWTKILHFAFHVQLTTDSQDKEVESDMWILKREIFDCDILFKTKERELPEFPDEAECFIRWNILSLKQGFK